MTNQTSCRVKAAKKQVPTDKQRIAALELLVQQLVFVLDAQGAMNSDGLDRWLTTAISRMYATNSVPAAEVAALQRLQDRVMA